MLIEILVYRKTHLKRRKRHPTTLNPRMMERRKSPRKKRRRKRW